jgi:hypothetical protein
MRRLTWCVCLLLLPASARAAGDEPPPAGKEDPGADLARLIHKAVVAKLPKAFEDNSGWGRTVPLPEMPRRPRLRRTVVEVDGRMEVPDGPWRKLRLRVDDPDRDLQVRVHSLKRVDAAYRLTLEADAFLRTEADVQHWRNGLLLADVTARADVLLNVFVECDLAPRLSAAGLRLEPAIQELRLNLKRIIPGRVSFHRAGLSVEGEALRSLEEEIKEALQAALRAKEPEVKLRAGEALARGMKEGKGPVTPAEVLKAAAPLLKADGAAPPK